jgi:hypothetical protein
MSGKLVDEALFLDLCNWARNIRNILKICNKRNEVRSTCPIVCEVCEGDGKDHRPRHIKKTLTQSFLR